MVSLLEWQQIGVMAKRGIVLCSRMAGYMVGEWLQCPTSLNAHIQKQGSAMLTGLAITIGSPINS